MIMHKNDITRSLFLLEKTRNRSIFNKRLEWAPLYSKLITSLNVFDGSFLITLEMFNSSKCLLLSSNKTLTESKPKLKMKPGFSTDNQCNLFA